MKQIAILVPGIMGSVLKLGERVIWPGPVKSLWFAYEMMDDLLCDELEATDVIRSVSFSVQYQSLIDDLRKCQFREDDRPPTLFVCPYDWRRSNADAAAALASKIDEASAAHSSTETEITLIAHSMGGLVSRYYLESGDFEGHSGFQSVRRLITLGTPHRGSPLALTAALGMEKRLFLSASQVRKVASDPRYPAVYELLPPQGEPFAWADGKNQAGNITAYEELDVYDPAIAETLGLMKSNLDAARNFHHKINLARRPARVRYFFFVGTRQTTISAVKLEWENQRFVVNKAEPEDAGDGTVPTWSGSITGVQGEPVGGEHGTIYRNSGLRRTMAILLGKKGVLAAAPDEVEVALRERVSELGKPVHLTLAFATGTNKTTSLLLEPSHFHKK